MEVPLSLGDAAPSISNKCVMAVVLSGALSKLIGMVLVSRNQRTESLRFELVGKVSDLVIHPVKGCRGVHTADATCTDVGLEMDGLIDRHWMIFKTDNTKFSMMEDPRLTLVKTQSVGDSLRLTAPGMPPLNIPRRPELSKDKLITKIIYGDTVQCVDCGQEANEWLSTFTGRQLQLVYSCNELSPRDVIDHEREWQNTAKKGDKTIFGYLTSYLMTTTASLKHINDRLTQPVSMDNFRPNIVIDSTIAFDEDNWEEVRIGKDLMFHAVEPCLRCTITIINPDTAERHTDLQPLKLLRSFRCRPPYGSKPLFGVYVSNDTEGRICVGDPVYVKRAPPSSCKNGATHSNATTNIYTQH